MKLPQAVPQFGKLYTIAVSGSNDTLPRLIAVENALKENPPQQDIAFLSSGNPFGSESALHLLTGDDFAKAKDLLGHKSIKDFVINLFKKADKETFQLLEVFDPKIETTSNKKAYKVLSYVNKAKHDQFINLEKAEEQLKAGTFLAVEA